MSFTILIVDDSALIRRLIRALIERNTDWQVCGEAENGQTAVDEVMNLDPDVVILDFQMPVMNGIDAARHIAVSAPRTAMLMLTVHDTVQLRREAHAAGIKEVLSKSERVADHLLASLKRLFAGPNGIIPTRPSDRASHVIRTLMLLPELQPSQRSPIPSECKLHVSELS